MRRINLTTYTAFICTMFATSVCFGQIQLEMQKKLLEKADASAFELVQMRANLPAKWAALQERDENHLTRIAEFKVGVGKVTEFAAHQQSNKVTLYHVGQQSRIDDPLSTEPPIDWKSEPFGNNDYWLFRKPGSILFKERGAKWLSVPTIPKSICPPTDPFNWCVGAFSAASNGKLTESHLDYFFGETRVCVAAKETSQGLLTYWGSPAPRKLASGTSILFDKVNHLPIRVEWDFYGKGWDPVDYATLPHATQSKLTISWQEFKNKESKVHLPVKIALVQTSNGWNPFHVELTNRIRWLLNDDVPDALFEDPSKQVVVLPTFPDYPADQK